MKSPQTIAKFRASLRARNDRLWTVATRRIADRVALVRGVAVADLMAHLDPAVFDRHQTTPARRRQAIEAACRDALNR
jgi:hypothetical protein